jgi:predicted nucleic acid-binding protein
MIAADTNILVYAHRADSPHHEAAASTIKHLAESGTPWAVAWPCVHEFLSVVTNTKIFRPPSSPGIAIQQVEIRMECPTLRLLGEVSGYWKELCGAFLSGNFGRQIGIFRGCAASAS